MDPELRGTGRRRQECEGQRAAMGCGEGGASGMDLTPGRLEEPRRGRSPGHR